MEAVQRWLSRYGLGKYSDKFQDNGWDELSILHHMDERDKNMCISSRGDIVRLNKALANLNLVSDESDAPTESNIIFQEHMEDVYNWLTKFKLGIYAPVFLENGWNNLSLLQHMTETDVDMCIAKRGDVAKFCKALKELSRDLTEEFPLETTLQQGTVEQISNGVNPGSSETQQLPGDGTRADSLSLASSYMTQKGTAVDISHPASIRHGQDSTTSYAMHGRSALCKGDSSDIVTNEQENRCQARADTRPFGDFCGSSYTVSHIGYSAHTTVYKKPPIYLMRDPTDTLPSYDSHAALGRIFARRYEERKHLFVETRAYKEMKDLLEDEYWGTVLGKPGDGKSTIIAHLMSTFKDDGFDPILLSSPHDWRSFVLSHDMECNDSKHLLIIDDMFGVTFLEKEKFQGWLSLIQTMIMIAEERKGNMRIVCSSRRYIFADVESALAKFSVFGKYFIVDMTDKRLWLSPGDKIEIFTKFAVQYNVPTSEEEIGSVDPPHGFPHCVVLYCTNSVFRKHGIQAFFTNPAGCVRQEIRNFSFYDSYKFLVLLLLLLSNNRLEANFFETMIDGPTREQQRILAYAGVTSVKESPDIYKAINALKNTYLKQDVEGFYCFTHESLMENIASEFIYQEPALAMDVVHFKYITAYICVKNSETGRNEHISLKTNALVPDYLTKLLAKRIEKEILHGNARLVSNIDVLRDMVFVNEWIRHITSDSFDNLVNILCSSKGSYPGCPADSQKEELRSPCYSCEYDDTLVECLSNFEKYEAVKAILKNELIQNRMDKGNAEWQKILQHGLDHISCSKETDVSAVCTFLSSSKQKMDGTIPLKNALQKCNAECAIHLLDNTDVLPLFKDEHDCGFFHYLVNSNLSTPEFKKLCSLLKTHHVDINSIDSAGDTALLHYLRSNKLGKQSKDIVKYLIESGADMCISNSLSGQSCLHYIISASLTNEVFYELTELLLEYNLDINMKNACGQSPLYMYVNKVMETNEETGAYKDIKYLVNKGAEINTINKVDGLSCLHLVANKSCSYEKFKSVCTVLLHCGASIDIKDTNGQSTLHSLLSSFSSDSNQGHWCMFLFQNGADILNEDNAGRSFLFALLKANKGKACLDNLSQLSDYIHDFSVLDEQGRNL